MWEQIIQIKSSPALLSPQALRQLISFSPETIRHISTTCQSDAQARYEVKASSTELIKEGLRTLIARESNSLHSPESRQK